MARLGLEPAFATLFANDFDAKKRGSYAANFGAAGLSGADINTLCVADLPGRADLVWASFPCQDLSLAGAGAGLEGRRSGAVHALLRLVRELQDEGRGPRLVVLENVCGTLSSAGGADFRALVEALAGLGFAVGGLVVDAALWTPQSRPRLFVVAAQAPHAELSAPGPVEPFHPLALRQAAAGLTGEAAQAWRWWRLPTPPARRTALAELLEPDAAVGWRSEAETEALLALMGPLHRQRVAAAAAGGGRHVGAVYRRTRVEAGARVQRAEVRFDGLSGCLRTPAGGSSRQLILVVEDGRVRSRLLSAREAARLMGLPDSYQLPRSYSDSYHLAGDGVAVPVVRWLSAHLLEPLARGAQRAAA